MKQRMVVAIGLLLLAGCAAPGVSVPTPIESEPMSQEVEPPATPVPSTIEAPDGVPDVAWRAIVDHISARIGEPVSDLTVVSAEAITWNDGSLGCPQPGQMYTQSLIDGFKVVVDVQGERYDYRVGRGTDVRLCGRNGPLEGGG